MTEESIDKNPFEDKENHPDQNNGEHEEKSTQEAKNGVNILRVVHFTEKKIGFIL